MVLAVTVEEVLLVRRIKGMCIYGVGWCHRACKSK